MTGDAPSVRRRQFLATLGAGVLGGCATGDTPTGTRSADAGTASPTDTSPGPSTGTATPELGAMERTWPGYGYDLGNSGFNPDTAPLSATALHFSRKVEGINTLPEPAVSPDTVFVASDARLYAIDRRSGGVRWDHQFDVPAYYYTPTVDGDVLYAVARGLAGASRGTDNPGTLVAFDAATGETRWRDDVHVTSSPAVHDDRLFHAEATADRGRVAAVDAATGDRRWTYTFGDGDTYSASFATPAIVDGLVLATGVVGANDDASGRLVALDPETGERAWWLSFDGPAEHAPVHSDGTLFLGTEDGLLHSIDLASRDTNWTRTFDPPLVNKPSVDADRVYGIADSVVYAVDRADGSLVWEQEVDPVQSTVTVTPGVAYVGGTTMDAFDAGTGERVWKREIDGFTGAYGVPVVVDGYMYVGACVKEDEGSLYDNYVFLLG